jgi:hypothetical protein
MYGALALDNLNPSGKKAFCGDAGDHAPKSPPLRIHGLLGKPRIPAFPCRENPTSFALHTIAIAQLAGGRLCL